MKIPLNYKVLALIILNNVPIVFNYSKAVENLLHNLIVLNYFI